MENPQMGFGVSSIICFVLVLSVMVIAARGQDYEVMIMLKKMIINAPTTLQWTDSDVCKWNHVQCDKGKRVTSIQIGNQNLQGSLPKELEKLSELENFECQGNNLTGSFPYLTKSLQNLFIQDNMFSSFPNDFFMDMSNLEAVCLDDNPFPQWQVPHSLEDCVALQNFSAQNVGFVGTIPDFFGSRGPFPGLLNLALSRNYFEGGLPASFSGSSIETLLLNGQNSNSKLNGTLEVLKNMTSLKQIWVHGNSFTGPIPDLSHHDQLYDVSLRDNQLTGVIPPSLVTLPSLKVVNLTNNNLQGSPPVFENGAKVDNNMNTGRNQFCTKIPGQPCSPLVNTLLSVVEPLGYPLRFAESWEGNDPCANTWTGIVCSGGNISVINFQSMDLSGSISPSFATLTSVTKLLIANNHITGTIPTVLTSMPLLQELDVSNNNLYGRVPSFREGVVLKLGGNPDIGKDKPTSGADSDSSIGDNIKNHLQIVIGIVVGAVILLGIGILLFIKYRRKMKPKGKVQNPNAIVHPRHSVDDNAMRISIAGVGGGGAPLSPRSNVYPVEAGSMVISIQVLREVTNNFSEENILGKGGFGTVYKGELEGGTKIAVKRMQSGNMAEKGLSEFMVEIAVLTKVRHKHLVSLLGYCLDGDERLLVYEYMPQGALSRLLFHWKEEGLKPLEWKTRLTIALDVARGVEYLHDLTQQIFIHRDLKPSNILLGDDLRAKVSDFGLVRLAPQGKASFQTGLAGTFGYLAPEYAATGRLTTKVDVYSFGVILMEMITGRKALDESRPEENFHLVTWFRRMLLKKDLFPMIIDPTIAVDDETFASISTVAELAGHCTSREPYQRPDMSHAVRVLSPLVEVWEPTEPIDETYGVNFEMTLPQALQRWEDHEGNSTWNSTYSSSSANTNTNGQSQAFPLGHL
ncbi:PREDICTED: receptor protein kinase TMK1-like [Lupinus angustifolius]|uniref:receptor protein kinase TMK1-like n=1 Tax=Lupinus angustifolius TaxID=3871 RepID=UPI00092E6D50|nr:PREDICTED: receptor protein kinase TMK1-like [Lupinus angustifolius]